LKKPLDAAVKKCDNDSDKEEGELSYEQERQLTKTNLEKPVRKLKLQSADLNQEKIRLQDRFRPLE